MLVHSSGRLTCLRSWPYLVGTDVFSPSPAGEDTEYACLRCLSTRSCRTRWCREEPSHLTTPVDARSAAASGHSRTPGRRDDAGPILIYTSAAVSEELSEGFRTLAPGLSRRESTTCLLGCLSARNNHLRQIADQAPRGGERTEVDVTNYVRVRISIVKSATDSERVCKYRETYFRHSARKR
jgi:hypothetical protein